MKNVKNFMIYVWIFGMIIKNVHIIGKYFRMLFFSFYIKNSNTINLPIGQIKLMIINELKKEKK